MSAPAATQRIHVVAGVLRRPDGAILLTQRRAGTDFAGTWEFPGGKCEPDEDHVEALRRELREELGIEVVQSQPLWRVPWDYAGKRVLLDVHEVGCWHGEPVGLEGQATRWVGAERLHEQPMPPADRPVLAALRLPRALAITPEPGTDRAAFLAAFERTLRGGVRLIQLRAKQLDATALAGLAGECRALAHAHAAGLIVNGHPELAARLGLDGVHLPAAALQRCHARPVPAPLWFGASCHGPDDLARAVAAGADYVCLGPVRPTPTHPHAQPLGWQRFATLARQSAVPVFALGGLRGEDLETARAAGAFGVAAIRGTWRGA